MTSPGGEFFDQQVRRMGERQNDTIARLIPNVRHPSEADVGREVGDDGRRIAKIEGDRARLDDDSTVALDRLQPVPGERGFTVRAPRDDGRSEAHKAMNRGLRASVGLDDGHRSARQEDPLSAAERELAEARLAEARERQ
jgi:hypothetical protein